MIPRSLNESQEALKQDPRLLILMLLPLLLQSDNTSRHSTVNTTQHNMTQHFEGGESPKLTSVQEPTTKETSTNAS